MERDGFDELHDRRGTQSIKWSVDGNDGAWIDTSAPAIQSLQDVALLPMWLADMDFPTAPAVLEALRRRVDHGIFGYTGLDARFFGAVASWSARRHGWKVEPEWVTTNSGVMPAINLLIQTFTEVGAGVIVQPPVFHPISEAVENNGRRLVNNSLRYGGGRYEMDFDDLEEKAAGAGAQMMVLCSPHNPVGRVWSVDELRIVADICAEHGVMLVSDEIHGDLTFPWSIFRSVGSLGESYHNRLVVCTGPSKAFNLPGLKTSLTIIPNAGIRDTYRNTMRNQNELFGANLFGMTALGAAYEDGEAWLESLLGYLAGNVSYVETFLAERLPPLTLVRPEALYLLWVDCRPLGLSGAELDARLREAGIWVEQGATFGREGEGFIRLTIACPRAVLEEAMSRIERAVGAH